MTTTDRRRLILTAAALPAALAWPGALRAQSAGAADEAASGDAPTAPVLGDVVLGDVVLGAEDAPVTVIEYASLTCPHCADFHIETWPEVKARYVDTGKVRFILREVYFDAYGLWGSMIARCGGEAGFYPIIEGILKRQSEWTRVAEPAEELQKIGRLNGLSSERMRACLSDEDYARALIETYRENAEMHRITGTPSFVIGGEIHGGNMGIDELSALIDRALEGS